MVQGHRLTDAEREQLERTGFVIRRDVFRGEEVAAMTEAGEALIADLIRDRQGHRLRMGSYVFDPDLVRGVTIKWEGDSDIVHGIEPFAHLSPSLHAWALDPRFVEPMQDFVGDDAPVLFTEKLNLKRPRHGGANPLHQDYPYWEGVADDVKRVATAIVFLDDATLENGCLHVVPGSHRTGVWKRRQDGDDFAGHEIDAQAYADVTPVPIEVSAGSVLMFGPYLVHQSAPNTSDRHRRALLYSYQPAGHTHMLDFLRRVLGAGARH